MGEVDLVEGTEVDVCGACAGVLFRLKEDLNREVVFTAGEASVTGGSSIAAFRGVVGTAVDVHVQRKNSPSTEL